MSDDKYVDEKATILIETFGYRFKGKYIPSHLKEAKDFVRQIIKDCQPKVSYDFIKKEAGLLVSRFDCECGLTHLQKIGIRTVLTEKGDLWDILQRAGVKVEE